MQYNCSLAGLFLKTSLGKRSNKWFIQTLKGKRLNKILYRQLTNGKQFNFEIYTDTLRETIKFGFKQTLKGKRSYLGIYTDNQ